MVSLSRWEFVGYGLLGLVIGALISIVSYAGPSPVEVFYRVSVSPGEGVVSVEMEVSGFSGDELVVSQRIYDDWMRLSGFSVVDGGGGRVSFVREAASVEDSFGSHDVYSYVIDVGGVDKVVVSYSVTPGAIGRHGHRGFLNETWGMLAGEQVFLQPASHPIGEARVSFTVPEGFEMVVNWPKGNGDGSFRPNVYEEDALFAESLAHSTIAFGEFETSEEKIGGAIVRVHNHASIDPEERATNVNHSLALCRYYQDLFGEFPGPRYDFVYTPKADDGVKVVAGMWSTGIGLTSPANDGWEWQLASHRLFHRWSWYKPYGTTVPEPEDVWFLEGKPNYYQVTSTAALGLANASQEFSALHERYLAERPTLDAPLACQATPPSPAHWEYLSFTKAPLVARLMAEKIREDSGGRLSFDEFTRKQYQTFGHQQGTYDLQEELEAYTGEDWNPFFESYVDGTRELPATF